MPLYMDRHEAAGVTPRDVAEAHMRDLEVQDKYGVRYLTYWHDPEREVMFCLADAPDITSAEAVHREAHGMVAGKVIEVDGEMVRSFLGRIIEPAPGEEYAASAFRTVLFTDIEGSTSLTQRLGDAGAMKVLRRHNEIIRDCLSTQRGREVKHTGDGVMASFDSVARALVCAVDIQRGFDEHNRSSEQPLRIRVGMSAGEPVTENDDLFGACVQLAARICSVCDPGSILASTAVKELALGKGFSWRERGQVPLRGFAEPVRVHELVWTN